MIKPPSIARAERKGLVILQLTLLVAVLVGVVCFWRSRGEEKAASKEEEKVSYVNAKDSVRYGHKNTPVADALPLEQAENIPFDPNTADSTLLYRVGLSRYQISNIYKYRAKGGVYHRPEQFKKLFGLTVAQWHHLEPLIRIGEQFRYLADTDEAYNPQRDGAPRRRGGYEKDDAWVGADSTQRAPHAGARRDTIRYPNKLQSGETIDLNRADTTDLKRIPGIGGYYARKIVAYREKLGGFVSLGQLDELENLPLEIEQYLTLNPQGVRKLNLNQATVRQLNAHPYLNYYQAKVIANHVRQIGPIRKLDELLMYEEFTAQDLQRLQPYVQL